MSRKILKLVIADDHHILLNGLTALLQQQPSMQIVGEYDNGKTLLDNLDETQPDIAIIDISMPGLNGIELARKMQQSHAQVRIIALSMHDDLDHIMNMMESGASAYLLKNSNDKELLEAIEMVASGRTFLSADVAARIAGYVVQQKKKTDEPHLTEREIEILKLIAQEYSNADIGKTLFISERTVETHRKNMLRKTNNKTIVGLIRYAIDRHLI